jgi:tryptophanyl-tRNA synthetase
MPKKKVLSGTRPTGPLHLGHLEGILRNWVKLQDDYDCSYFIADLHYLTTRTDTSQLQEYIRDVVIDLLSVGIDPERSTLFVQSHIPEHYQLHLLLSMITPVGWLERCPTYKEQVQQLGLGDSVGYGMLGYPVLMATDIVIHDADFVPIGEDQLPHLEVTREIVRRFNSLYGQVLVEPKALLTPVKRLLGTDRRKMSKSYGNAIYLKDSPEQISKLVATMVTDPKRPRRSDPGHPEECNVFVYQGIYNCQRTAEIAKDCKQGILGCRECKQELAKAIIAELSPIQANRKELEANPKYIKEVLSAGDAAAQKSASATLSRVFKAMKL